MPEINAHVFQQAFTLQKIKSNIHERLQVKRTHIHIYIYIKHSNVSSLHKNVCNLLHIKSHGMQQMFVPRMFDVP